MSLALCTACNVNIGHYKTDRKKDIRRAVKSVPHIEELLRGPLTRSYISMILHTYVEVVVASCPEKMIINGVGSAGSFSSGDHLIGVLFTVSSRWVYSDFFFFKLFFQAWINQIFVHAYWSRFNKLCYIFGLIFHV